MRSDIIARINTDRLVHNYQAIRAKCGPDVLICATLKGDAYGHGITAVAPVLQAAGVDHAAVATLQEAVELRNAGWHRPILVLGNVLAVADVRERRERVRAIVKYQPTLTITDMDAVAALARVDLHSAIDVHIKVDTGMGRMGCPPDAVLSLIQAVRETPCLNLRGIYSHLASADQERRDFALRQCATFSALLHDVESFLPPGVIRHIANSSATITMPEASFDMVRPGIALFGYHPADHMAGLIDLKPVMRLVSHLALIKELPAGHCVGYGQTFTTTRRTILGIVPIGYCDGYLRSLSNEAIVSTQAGDAPVIGRISMDNLAVDLTDLPSLKLGDEVTLIDDDPERPNSVVSLARHLGTIPYELTCLLGRRIQRVQIGKSCARPTLWRTELNRNSITGRCVRHVME